MNGTPWTYKSYLRGAFGGLLGAGYVVLMNRSLASVWHIFEMVHKIIRIQLFMFQCLCCNLMSHCRELMRRWKSHWKTLNVYKIASTCSWSRTKWGQQSVSFFLGYVSVTFLQRADLPSLRAKLGKKQWVEKIQTDAKFLTY